jgi:hypothetical protein
MTGDWTSMVNSFSDSAPSLMMLMGAGFTMHGFIHALLVVTIIMLLIDLISECKPDV